MSLTREDMLRELELLPAWRLNAPLQMPAEAPLETKQEAAPGDAREVSQTTPVMEAVVEVKEMASPEAETQAPALPDVASMDWEMLHQYVIGSGDQNADWLFVGDVPTEGDASILLDKMLIAIQLQRGKNVYLTQLSAPEYFKRQIELIQPKVIFVFGEKAAQTLLNSPAPLDDLRSKVHQYENVALIVSYAPSHLLKNTQDKAKAWADLCLVRDFMQSVK